MCQYGKAVCLQAWQGCLQVWQGCLQVWQGCLQVWQGCIAQALCWHADHAAQTSTTDSGRSVQDTASDCCAEGPRVCCPASASCPGHAAQLQVYVIISHVASSDESSHNNLVICSVTITNGSCRSSLRCELVSFLLPACGVQPEYGGKPRASFASLCHALC